jgi:phage baseplate assembly protein W
MPRTREQKIYNFKSVGQTQAAEMDALNVTINERPIGIATPLQLGRGNDGLFATHKKLLDQISDNLRNLISTNHGERVGLFDFGANLQTLLFDFGTEDTDAESARRISTAVEKYMPFVELVTFEPFILKDESDGALVKVGLRVVFTVPNLSSTQRGIDILLYTAG